MLSRFFMPGVVLTLAATMACETNDSPPDDAPSEARAHQALQALRAQGLAVDVVHTMRDAGGRFAYLRIRHTEPGKISRHYGITPDGNVQPINVAESAFAGEHRATWGSIGLETATMIARQTTEDSYAFAGWFDPARWDAEIVLTAVRRLDPRAVRGGKLPVVYFEASAATVMRTIAHNPMLARIASAELGEPKLAAWPSESAGRMTNAVTSRSESAFLEQDIYGEDIPVGMIELIPKGCGIYQGHEAFVNLTGLSYKETLHSCTTNADCLTSTKCGPASGAACVNGNCVLHHLTATASQISGNMDCGATPVSGTCTPGTTTGCRGGMVCDSTGVRCEPVACDYDNPDFPGVWLACNGLPCTQADRCLATVSATEECFANEYHASRVQLFVANNSPVGAADSKTVLDEAYSYMVDNDVYIVNESYVVPTDTGLRDTMHNPGMLSAYVLSPFTHKAALSDYYARKDDILFVQAAGNSNEIGGGPQLGIDTLCGGFNGLCVGAFDAYDSSNMQTVEPASISSSYHGPITGYSLADGDDKTRWGNPVLPTGMRLELSKPDVMAEGESAYAAKHDGAPWDWVKEEGTSIAAPVVAGLAAMFSEACFGPGVSIHNPAWLRAVFRTSSWDDHHLEFSQVPSSWPQDACPSSVTHIPQYPTADARLGCDYKAGAGVVNAENLLAWCDGSQSGGGGDPESDCVPTPQDPCHSGFGGGLVPYDEDPTGWIEIPPNLQLPDIATYVGYTYTIATRGSSLRVAQQLPEERISVDDLSNYAMYQLTTFPNGLNQNYRVRGTMSYYSCPGQPSQITDGALGVTEYPRMLAFDYAFCGRETAQSDFECVILSEGLHESNEGFDFIMPKSLDEAATYLIAPRDWTACPIGAGGVGNGNLPPKYERVEEAIRVWYQ